MAEGDNSAVKWRPGVSANPGGRPAWLKEAREAMRVHVPTAVAKLVEIMGGTMQNGEKVTIRMQKEAACEILNRALGLPVQTLQGPDEMPLIPDGSRAAQLDMARRVAFLLAQGLQERGLIEAPPTNTLEVKGESIEQ